MKKSLLIWGVLVVVALCFVGCCYYNTTSHCAEKCTRHCSHNPCCNEAGKKCPDNARTQNDGDDVETLTVEAVEIVPVNAPDAAAGNSGTAAGKSDTMNHSTTAYTGDAHSHAAPAAAN